MVDCEDHRNLIPIVSFLNYFCLMDAFHITMCLLRSLIYLFDQTKHQKSNVLRQLLQIVLKW